MSKQKQPRDRFKRIVDGSKPNAFIIRGGKTKHASKKKNPRPGREPGKHEFVQAELLAIFLDDPSKQDNIGLGHKAALVAEINGRLVLNLSYQSKYPNTPVNHMTVARALRALREAHKVIC